MIEEISIKNVGGIASISMRLETGFTVITGESGAGKSSLVRALELIGGKRSQALFIRSGEEEASVEAVHSAASSSGARNTPTGAPQSALPSGATTRTRSVAGRRSAMSLVTV